ncbi:hypothetical protein FB451DRAFT_1556572 [Mycena latifolia]|nr:hypothetical protein FB451DRAFT_1556572 [Mycena latifolia]
MSDTDKTASAEPASDNEKLIAALQICFYDLVQKQEEQRKIQQERADRLYEAVAALKPQASPVPDKKTVFWKAYMKLADEHDNEFKGKYGADLDTALIFAGLFSAVSSAFIIQIEPQLTTTSEPSRTIVVVQSLLYISLFTTLLAALLTVLGKQWIMHYQEAGSRGTIEERGLERQRKLDGLRKWKLESVLQMFPMLLQLALFLFSAALSIYLWTVHHGIAIIVLALTSLGFAVYVLQLGSAIISPDSPFQTPLAPFLIQLIPATLRILKATVSQLRELVNSMRTSWSRSIESGTVLPCVALHVVNSNMEPSSDPYYYSPPSFPQSSPEVHAALWVLETSTDPNVISIVSEIAVDLQWPLDLDLRLPMTRIAQSFDSCLDISWQGNHASGEIRKGMALRASSYGRAYCSLRVIANTSLMDWTVPSIFGTLDHETIEIGTADPVEYSHILNVAQIIKAGMLPTLALDWADQPTIQLALHVIPSLNPHDTFDPLNSLEHFVAQFQGGGMTRLNESSFANYLCCVNSFLAPTSPRLTARMDKRRFRDLLITQLFKALRVGRVDSRLTATIINTTAQLANVAKNSVSYDIKRIVNLIRNRRTNWKLSVAVEASQFCSTFLQLEGPLDVLVSSASLARFEAPEELSDFAVTATRAMLDVEWVYLALEYVQRSWEGKRANAGHPEAWDGNVAREVESLLQILILGDLRQKPPVAAFQIILHGLSASRGVSFAAFLVLYRGKAWFLDPDLRSIMQQSSLWHHLGRTALRFDKIQRVAAQYVELGEEIAGLPEWKQPIFTDLPTWITVFAGDTWGGKIQVTQAFMSVIRTVWVPKAASQYDFLDETEESWALAITALSHMWGIAHSSAALGPDGFARLAKCAVSTSLVVDYYHGDELRQISTDCRAIFASHIGKTLVQAAAWAKNGIPQNEIQSCPGPDRSDNQTKAVIRVAELLGVLGQKLATEFKPGAGEMKFGGLTKRYRNWLELENHILKELRGLRDSLGIGEL